MKPYFNKHEDLYNWYINPLKAVDWLDSLTIGQREAIVRSAKISKMFNRSELIGLKYYFEIPRLRLVS
jgi:hypothetical protein